MHIHIMGICGTFMAGLAVLAKQQGHHVTGSDEKVYPPMSTQLEEQGITLFEGFKASNLDPCPDVIVIGNAMKRGNPEVEAVLDRGLPYCSGPQWLAQSVLAQRWVIAIAGTHGKTTTSSMVAWILEFAGLQPGFLIGGIPKNFGVSARLGAQPFFVIEADEYDSAFFDKRSKFIHYRPRTAVLNNLEYDHADIFPDLSAIEQQFHHFVRTIPGNGLIIANGSDQNLKSVLQQGCWTTVETFALDAPLGDWSVTDLKADGSEFTVVFKGKTVGVVSWALMGKHNIANALAAIASAQHAGVPAALACEALNSFQNVKRRLEIYAQVQGVTIYDDFAHHPTAITETLQGLRARVGAARILAVVDFASYTMRHGSHRANIPQSLATADRIYLKRPADSDWDLQDLKHSLSQPVAIYDQTDNIIADLVEQAKPGDHILIMSNRGFEGIHGKLVEALAK